MHGDMYHIYSINMHGDMYHVYCINMYTVSLYCVDDMAV